MKPSVLLIAYHFSPSNEIGARRPTALASELVSRGYEVIVISAFEGATHSNLAALIDSGFTPVPIAEPRKFILSGLAKLKRFIKTNMTRRGQPPTQEDALNSNASLASARANGDQNILVRIAAIIDTHKLWAARVASAAQSLVRKHRPCAIYCTAPPNSSLLAAAWVASRNRLPLLVDLRDAWAVGGVHSPLPNGCTVLLYRILEREVFKRARAVFVTASGLAEKYCFAYPHIADRIHSFRNGYDGIPLQSISGTGNRLRILFAGEIYVNRDPFGFLEALDRLLARDDVDANYVEVDFVGRCDSYRGHSLSAWLRGKRAEKVVRISPPVSMEDVLAMTQAATVMLNFAQGARTMIPAKSYDQMASGREIFLLCERDSDTAKLFEGRRGVIRVDPADSTELDTALLDLYRRHVIVGLATVPMESDVREFSRAHQTKLYVDCIESAIARGPG